MKLIEGYFKKKSESNAKMYPNESLCDSTSEQ